MSPAAQLAEPCRQEALAALTLALQDDDYDIRKCAFTALSDCLTTTNSQLPACFILSCCLQDERLLVRVAAAEVLAQLGVAGNMAPIMIANAWLDDARQHVRRLAVQILGRSCAGHCARDALDAAVGHLRDRRFFVRKGAVEVLGTGNAVAFCYLQGTVEVA